MKLKLLPFIVSALALTSCLKSKDSLGINGDTGTIITEIADVNTEGSLKIISVNAVPATESILILTLRVHAGRSNQPAGPVHVKLVQDPAAVGAAGLLLFPASGLTIPTLEFDVPADTKEINVPITINKNNLDLTKSYGLGLKIAEVNQGVISELAKSIVVNILVKNQFDGVYNLKGVFYHPTSSNYERYNLTVEMHTSGPTSIKMYSPD